MPKKDGRKKVATITIDRMKKTSTGKKILKQNIPLGAFVQYCLKHVSIDSKKEKEIRSYAKTNKYVLCSKAEKMANDFDQLSPESQKGLKNLFANKMKKAA